MMSDVEEPPTKVLKMDVAQASLDSTMEQEEGQEEWLSEGVLTDDDYLPGNVLQTQEQDTSNPNNDSTQDISDVKNEPKADTGEIKMEQNIEDTLNDFEKTEPEQTDKDKDAFDEMIQKTDKESDLEQSEKHTDDDGHNTDDLLRMLGEDEGKMKKKVLSSIRDKKAHAHAHAQRQRTGQSSDDDEYSFQGARVTRLKVAKNVLNRKQPTKAETEDLSDKDSDMSDDAGSTAKKMFASKPPTSGGRAQRSARAFTSNNKTEKPKPPPKQYTNKSKSLLKQDPKPEQKQEALKHREEFLDEDDFDLDDDVCDSSVVSVAGSQKLRRPERMNEEILSDDDTHSEDDSLYDVLPSSDSEDMDDWFTLDIRAERAGDYLPWLGDKAHKLLTEEKHRVTARLSALRQSVSALQSSERVQSDQIKVATEALHDIDAMLAAA